VTYDEVATFLDTRGRVWRADGIPPITIDAVGKGDTFQFYVFLDWSDFMPGTDGDAQYVESVMDMMIVSVLCGGQLLSTELIEEAAFLLQKGLRRMKELGHIMEGPHEISRDDIGERDERPVQVLRQPEAEQGRESGGGEQDR